MTCILLSVNQFSRVSSRSISSTASQPGLREVKPRSLLEPLPSTSRGCLVNGLRHRLHRVPFGLLPPSVPALLRMAGDEGEGGTNARERRDWDCTSMEVMR